MSDYPLLKVMTEWRAWPTWVAQADGGEDNPEPHALGLPDDLADRLVAWSDEYDAHIDQDDFHKPLFDDPADSRAFAERGLALAREVAAAVGDRFAVVRYYFPEESRSIDVG